MRFALISDIHSNADALARVLEDIDRKKIDRIFCLGDIVGYGPDPEFCVDKVRERCEFSLLGNHDKALFGGAERFNPYAREAIDWTRDRLKPGLLRPRAATARWNYLQELLLEKRVGEFLFVHGSPRDPVNEYIYREDIYFNDGKLREIFGRFERALFVGHTHLPMVIGDDMKTWVPEDGETTYTFAPGRKYIINVGSVGQPRDRDRRAAWCEYDDDRLFFHRVEYDIEAVIARIQRVAALDPVLGTRLRDGM